MFLGYLASSRRKRSQPASQPCEASKLDLEIKLARASIVQVNRSAAAVRMLLLRQVVRFSLQPARMEDETSEPNEEEANKSRKFRRIERI